MVRDSFADKLFLIGNRIVMTVLLVAILYPLVYITSASISDPSLVNNGSMWLWPKGITLEGYERVFANKEIWIGYRNTIGYTLLGTAINLLLTIPCAYALSRRDVAGRNALMAVFVFTMFFSGGLIPTFLLVKSLGMHNSIWALLIPNAASMWNLIVTRTFFQSTIPRELEEAAEMDGCSHFTLMLRIILPLSLPIVAVMALFYGVSHWNQYFSAMIYLSNRSLFPLQLILREILVLNEISALTMDGDSVKAVAEQAKIADMIKYAVMIVSALPLLVAYPFLQRFFVKGVMIGSIKG
ncbi:carbohydrate ABC transporter permease [Paenibacillus contaminans]|uniref:Carbohydrate ABC transporter permease n=1 Tax=Paenibacillus contaminans TaxID=450362 RepID=A0A329MA95_9BACL|nr:carbohydrate ABC transporter permease [Paenibacillus contaminans]RAV16066.1 carbohydrate ABC transporter permease [Paenibacillus contaminans]